MARSTLGGRQLIRGVAMLLAVAWFTDVTAAQTMDDLLKAHVPKLREVERYQLNIAQKYFAQKDWKVAMAEYEKYLTLYETSTAAPYVQLRWSLCLVELRKQNTAIKEGFQSVIDYWPDSPEAVWANYFIGSTYKSMGRIPQAKKAYQRLVKQSPKHLAAAYGMWDAADIAANENDASMRIKMLKQLTFDVTRTRASRDVCQRAAQGLAEIHFYNGAFSDGAKALETTYPKQPELTDQIVYRVQRPISQQTRDDENRSKGRKLADTAIQYVKSQTPAGSDNEEKAIAKRFALHVISLHSAAQRNKEVVEAFQQLLKRFGTDDELLGRFAQWYKSQGKYDEARSIYRRFENSIDGLNNVAYSHREQRQYLKAVPIYRELAGRDPDEIVKWRSEEAMTNRYARKYAEAIAVYQELMKLDVSQTTTWLWEIAQTHQSAGQYKEAIGVYRQCDDHFPENNKNMAWCHRQLKQPKEAILLYRQIIGGSEGMAPWAQLQIGYTCEEMKAKESAIKAFQQVCRKYPKDRHASVAHAHLQSAYKISVTLGGATDD